MNHTLQVYKLRRKLRKASHLWSITPVEQIKEANAAPCKGLYCSGQDALPGGDLLGLWMLRSFLIARLASSLPCGPWELDPSRLGASRCALFGASASGAWAPRLDFGAACGWLPFLRGSGRVDEPSAGRNAVGGGRLITGAGATGCGCGAWSGFLEPEAVGLPFLVESGRVEEPFAVNNVAGAGTLLTGAGATGCGCGVGSGALEPEAVGLPFLVESGRVEEPFAVNDGGGAGRVLGATGSGCAVCSGALEPEAVGLRGRSCERD